MAKQATKSAPKSESDSSTSRGGATADAKTITKADAARTAIAEGFDGPQDAVNFIRKRYGIEMNPQHFSAIKSQLKKKEGAPKGKPGRKPKALVEGFVPSPVRRTANGGGDLLEAMEAMKPLVSSLGADQVKRIVDLLG